MSKGRPPDRGPFDEVGVDLGPDDVRGLLDGWTATGGTGDRTGECTGSLGQEQAEAHAHLAMLTDVAVRLAEMPFLDGPVDIEPFLRCPDPLPLADGLPAPAVSGALDRMQDVTVAMKNPFWSGDGRPTDSGFGLMEERTDVLEGVGRTRPGVSPVLERGTDGGFTDPAERTQTRVVRPVARVGGPAWVLVVLGALVVILGGLVVFLLVR